MDEKKEELNDEFINAEESNDNSQQSEGEIDKKVQAAQEAAATVAEASEIIKSQEEAYATRRADEEKRWEEQEKKRSDSEEQSSKRLEALASTVLDAAEVANRSASAVTNSHRSLTIGAKTLTNAAANGNLKSTIVISLTVALLIATAGLFSLVMYQMSKKMDQLDLMIVALGTRTAEMKNSLGSIEDLTKKFSTRGKINQQTSVRHILHLLLKKVMMKGTTDFPYGQCTLIGSMFLTMKSVTSPTYIQSINFWRGTYPIFMIKSISVLLLQRNQKVKESDLFLNL